MRRSYTVWPWLSVSAVIAVLIGAGASCAERDVVDAAGVPSSGARFGDIDRGGMAAAGMVRGALRGVAAGGVACLRPDWAAA